MPKYTMNVKPTEYAGCLFRSRLEARWAVFFDTLNIKWEYEPERYTLGPTYRYYHGDKSQRGAWWYTDLDHFNSLSDEEKNKCVVEEDSYLEYLPDFYLPKFDTWVDVKGVYDEKDNRITLSSVDHRLLPIHRQSDLPREDLDTNGLLYLGNIPDPTSTVFKNGHLLFQNYKGPISEIAAFEFYNNEIILNRTKFWGRVSCDDSAKIIEKYIVDGFSTDYAKMTNEWLFDTGATDETPIRHACARARSYRFGEHGYK